MIADVPYFEYEVGINQAGVDVGVVLVDQVVAIP